MNLSQATRQVTAQMPIIALPALKMTVQKSGKNTPITDDMIGMMLQKLIKEPYAA